MTMIRDVGTHNWEREGTLNLERIVLSDGWERAMKTVEGVLDTGLYATECCSEEPLSHIGNLLRLEVWP
jgi:hypothetical protein